MVPLFSQRRHRLHPVEVPAVMTAVRLRLQQLVKERSNFDEAIVLFRVLTRFEVHRSGRPNYVEPLTWEIIRGYLKNGTILGEDLS
jgi:hypothetical protein